MGFHSVAHLPQSKPVIYMRPLKISGWFRFTQYRPFITRAALSRVKAVLGSIQTTFNQKLFKGQSDSSRRKATTLIIAFFITDPCKGVHGSATQVHSACFSSCFCFFSCCSLSRCWAFCFCNHTADHRLINLMSFRVRHCSFSSSKNIKSAGIHTDACLKMGALPPG